MNPEDVLRAQLLAEGGLLSLQALRCAGSAEWEAADREIEQVNAVVEFALGAAGAAHPERCRCGAVVRRGAEEWCVVGEKDHSFVAHEDCWESEAGACQTCGRDTGHWDDCPSREDA